MLLCIQVNVMLAQEFPLIEWQRSFGGSELEVPKSIIQASDGSLVIASFAFSNDLDLIDNVDERNVWLMKMTTEGEVIWQKFYGSIGGSLPRLTIRESTDGGFVVATRILAAAQGISCDVTSMQGWVFKVDANGEMVWEKCLGGSEDDGLSSIEQTFDNGYILCGGSRSSDGDLTSNNGWNDIWVVKLDSEGSVIWSRNYGGTGMEGGIDAIQLIDGNYLVAASGRSDDLLFADCNPYFATNDTGFLLKLDQNGDVLWKRCFGGTSTDIIWGVAQDQNGTIWVIGYTYSIDGDIEVHHGQADAWLVKFSSDGQLLANKCYGGTENDFFHDILPMNDTILVLGYTNSINGDISNNYGSNDVWLVAVQDELELITEKNYGGSDQDHGFGLVESNDGAIAFCASSYSSDFDVTSNYGSGDSWIVKLKPWAVGIEEGVYGPSLSLFPNPANDHLYITLNGLSEDEVEIVVIDAVGRVVTSDVLASGTSSATMSLNGLASGTYQIRAITSGSRTLCSRFIKL